MALGRWKQLDPSQRLIATASYQKAKRSDRVLTLTLTLRDALPCTNQSRRFNQLHYARFLASSSRPNISGTVGFGGPTTISSCSTGAFFWERNSESKTYISAWSTGQSSEYQLLRYLASKSNSLYVNTTTVQPASLRLMPCIRT